MNLDNAWVVVTGASRGLGVNIAEEFAKKGANLILVARSTEGLARTRERVEELGAKAHTLAFDLGDVGEMRHLVSKIEELTPHIDVLVNNAGLEKYGHFVNYRLDDITSIINVNLVAPMEMTKLLLPRMLARRKGHIINISSLGGKLGEVYNSIYVASKGGMEMWTDALRQELYDTGVKVSSVNPGGVTDAGMIFNIGVNYPAFLGSCTTQGVANEVINCTEKCKSRVFVNSVPVKPLIVLGVIFPRMVDTLFRWIGMEKINRKKVELRIKSDKAVDANLDPKDLQGVFKESH